MTATLPSSTSTNIALDAIEPNPFQPRRSFDPGELRDLAESIREVGVLQDVLVRPNPKGKGYQLVAGERRCRAARLAGLTAIPAKIRELSDLEMSRLALVENVQRADLNPLDEARGIQNHIRLAAENGESLTYDGVRRMLGKSAGWLEKKRKLLTLPDFMQEAVERNGAVQSSVLEIARLPEVLVDERHSLVDAIDNNASYSQVKGRVEQLLQEHADKESWRKESQDSDAFTKQQQKAAQARQVEAVREVKSRLMGINAWLDEMSDADYEAVFIPWLQKRQHDWQRRQENADA